MRKSIVLLVSAAVGITALAPAAYARHRKVHHMMMAAPMMTNPRMNAAGQFYATPISATGIGIPGLAGLPGLDLAAGAANGIAGPLIGPGGIGGAVIVPGADAAGRIVDPLFAPLAGIAPPA